MPIANAVFNEEVLQKIQEQINLVNAKPLQIKVDHDGKGMWEQLQGNINQYVVGIDPYATEEHRLKSEYIKKEEEESNIIRIDLEKAAKELAGRELSESFPMMKIDEESESFLKLYDKYYDILYKSKI